MTDVVLMSNLRPGLSGNPFFCFWKGFGKKDWVRKTDKAAQIMR